MTLYMYPDKVFDLVADMRNEAVPTTGGSLTAPVLVGPTDDALNRLANVVGALPAELASKLDVLACSFLDAVADAVEADQLGSYWHADEHTRTYDEPGAGD